MTSFLPFPVADYIAHQNEIEQALRSVLAGGKYVLGEQVSDFESEFADFVGTEKAVGVANGTDAIELILRALGIGQGDLVVVPSHTAVASAAGILRAGATPLFVDVDPESMTVCPDAFAELMTSEQAKRVRALLAVHLYGHPCDMERLMDLCEQFGVTLIEDGAQAHGAEWRGRRIGSIARAAAFSFYPTKNLGAVGDGGAITTSDSELAERIRMLRQYGWVGRYVSEVVGINSRLDEMQAAILRVKLRTLKHQLERRRFFAERYNTLLGRLDGLDLPIVRSECLHAWHLYVVRSAVRDPLMRHLQSLDIPVGIHYPVPIHQQPGYVPYAQRGPALPVTERLANEVLSLPLHPYMNEDEYQRVTLALQDWCGGNHNA
jgi:dTDP-4-amino-4,6-dideoxygalactose transaminase